MAQRFHLALSTEEKDALNGIMATGAALKARRARIVLMTADEVPQVAIAAEVGLSERQVRRWQRAFQRERMGIFGQGRRDGGAGRVRARKPRTANPAAAAVEAGPASSSDASPQPGPGVMGPRQSLTLAPRSGVAADDPMSEAGRKILFFHFERMLLNEPGSRLGQDIEAVHDMRVATRRMRSAFEIFAPFYKPRFIQAFQQELRRIARALGAVRDLDVFIDKLSLYRAGPPPQAGDSLMPLLEVCESQRETARARLLELLDSPTFAVFVEGFGDFLTTPNAGALKVKKAAPAAYQVRHVVPRLVYARYEAARAYETVLERASIDTLHALRIECKRLRYAMEFFAEVLGPEIKNVIGDIKRLQDHLGDLHDAEVAGALVREFVTRYEKSQADIPLLERRSIEQVVQYMAYQFAEKHRLTMTFPDAWQSFNRYEVRRDLALAIAAL